MSYFEYPANGCWRASAGKWRKNQQNRRKHRALRGESTKLGAAQRSARPSCAGSRPGRRARAMRLFGFSGQFKTKSLHRALSRHVAKIESHSDPVARRRTENLGNVMDVLKDFIYPVVDEIRDSVEGAALLEKSPETPLFGKRSVLKSMGLVALIVALEQQIEEELDLSLTIANDKSLSRTNSPFLTMGSLAQYVNELIAEARGE
jgi:hypothetical protein